MPVKTEILQLLSLDNTFTHFRNVSARFYNGVLQAIRWGIKDSTIEYEIRVNEEGLKELEFIINEITKFSESKGIETQAKLEKFKGRKIRLQDLNENDEGTINDR